eukprot:CAMPEP_0174876114 /NCGR_PEP_ID=MMETSP1114-20130205/79505_1 /TAXON_ID=312471 /ORGANISM="Neobodo designis, Strain CCAP 1951/1" /LENGTH=475 /DNA_ID=CAMNT_0016111469 /DNA_START=27 /DNA_END=1454 /DNA_ORIENTATION=+
MADAAFESAPEPPKEPSVRRDDSDDDASVSDVDDVSGYRDTDKFKTFRKHARDVYQSIATNEIIWPSKSIDVMPYYREANQGCIEQTLVSGTITGGSEQNYVKFYSLVLPTDHTAELATCIYDEELRELGAFGMAPSAARFKVDMMMAHDGDVRKVRVMPHNPNVLATSSSTDIVYVFDRATILRTAPPNNPARPLLSLMPAKPDPSAPQEVHRDFKQKRLKHARELEQQAAWDARTHPGQHKLALDSGIHNAWALDFSKVDAGRLLVGGEEGLAVWALAELKKSDAGKDVPVAFRESGVLSINDGKWSPHDASTIAVACGSGSGASFGLLDTRQQQNAATVAIPEAAGTANSVEFSPHDPYVLAVGGSNGGVHIFDIRQLSQAQRHVYPHKAGSEVTVAWCPHDPAYIATSSSDTNACVVHVEKGATLFVHTGHADPVVDVCWSPHDPFAGQLISVDDNVICAWKPRNHFFAAQ